MKFASDLTSFENLSDLDNQLNFYILRMTTSTEKLPRSLFLKITGATAGIASVLLGIKVIGFFEKLLLAKFFGTSYQVDAYVMSFSLMIIFWDFLRGILEPSYLPTLIEYREQAGEEKSWEFTSTVLNLMTIVFTLLIGLGVVFTPQLVALLARGFEGERLQTAIGLTRLMLTGAGFFAVAIVTGFTLNSYKRFLLAVADDVVFKVSGFLGLLLLARYIGIYGLGLGIAMGSWLAPAIHLIGLRRYFPWYKLTINLRQAPVRKMFRLMTPLFAGTACIESRRLVDNFFASFLREGSLAALDYSYRLIEFTYAFLAKPLATVVLPYFSELSQQQDHGKLTTSVQVTLNAVLLVFTPMAVCLFALKEPVIKMLFERDAFDAVSTQLTVTALTYYAFGLVSFALEMILTRAYFSVCDTLTPTIIEVVTIITHLTTILMLRNTLGHGSIALAFTLSKTVKALLLYGLLRRQLPELKLTEMGWLVGKIALAASVMLVGVNGCRVWLSALFSISSFISQAFVIVVSGGCGVIIFFSLTAVFKVQELRLMWRAIEQYVKKYRE